MFESDPAVAPSASDFVERMLRADPDVSFAEVKERAAALGFHVPPFLYGATRRRLGLASRPDASVVDVAGATEAEATPSTETPSSKAPSTSAPPQQAPSRKTAPTEAVDPAPREQPTAASPAGGKPAADAPKTKAPSGFQFAVDVLRMSPEISFQELKARAAMEGYRLQPIVYGRAKALLGLVPTKPRKPKTPPRGLVQVESTGNVSLPTKEALGSIEKLVETVRALDNDRKRLHDVLNAIYEICDNALRGPKRTDDDR